MQVSGGMGRLILATTALVGAMAWTDIAQAAKPAIASGHTQTKTTHVTAAIHKPNSRLATSGTPISHKLLKGGKQRYASYGGISCVPFARAATGMDLKGNAANWWDAAAGVYERGTRPEAGSVLNFRATGRMRLGHVAVVSAVINSREVEIDHANWTGPGLGRGNVSRGVSVVDVSENNDWSAVRVALSHTTTYGSTYPTYGFIYDRPDRTMVARHAMPANDEVAEAPYRAVR